MLTSLEIARMTDLSLVRAESTLDELEVLAQVAKQYSCICVYALPAHTPRLIELVADRPDILVGGAPGFAHGATTTTMKAAEARELREMGCGELDTMINIAWLKAGKDDLVRDDIRAVVDAAEGLPVKVILECHYLTEEEIVRGSNLGVEAGVAFVKTGTGWPPTGATLENIKLIQETVAGRCAVKASGGVRGIETLEAMYNLGATRFGIGLKSGIEILEKAKAREA